MEKLKDLFNKKIIFTVIIFYVLGVFSYRNNFFPISFIKSTKNTYLQFTKRRSCPVIKNKNKLDDLQEISKIKKFKNIIWGDSLIAGMHDSRLYGVENYIEIGHNSQIVFCALEEIQYIIDFKPKKVIIYLGGNDADGQSWYGPDQASEYYKRIIEKLLANKITPIIHLIHGSTNERNKEYLNSYNDSLEKIAKSKDLKIIPAIKRLSFSDNTKGMLQSNNPLSRDGEHLKPQGYTIWFKHIKKYVKDF